MIENNENTVKIVIKNFPLNIHHYARDAAAAALAAHSMGKFWEFHKALYKNRKFDDENMRKMAVNFGLDPDEFIKKMKSKNIRDKVNRDTMDAKKTGATGTPTVFINGKLLKNRSLDGFQYMIDEELKKKK